MKAKRKVGDIIEFAEGNHPPLVDRVSDVYISSKGGVTYWLEHHDGTITDKEILRLIEAGPEPGELHETWPSKYRAGQRVRYKCMQREQEGEIAEVEWKFSKTSRVICYWMTDSYDTEEKDVICELDTQSTSSPETTCVPPLNGLSASSVPASERGPRLVKRAECDSTDT